MGLLLGDVMEAISVELYAWTRTKQARHQAAAAKGIASCLFLQYAPKLSINKMAY